MDLVNLALVQKAVRDAHVDHIGPPGPKGDKGDKGDPLTWDDLTEEQKASLKGADGKSAYQYAQEGGYTGTETDFSAKLAEEISQADWNQNDSTAADYVKNRPFYTGDPVETVFVEESTVPFEDNGDVYISVFVSTFVPIVGETYKISWDGTVYECTCTDFEEYPILGNPYLVSGDSDTGEPFVITADAEVGALVIGTTDTSASHTFSISCYEAPIVKIPSKYIDKDTSGYIAFHKESTMTEQEAQNYTIAMSRGDLVFIIWDGICIESLYINVGGNETTLPIRTQNGEAFSIKKNDEGLFNLRDRQFSGISLIRDNTFVNHCDVSIGASEDRFVVSPNAFSTGTGSTDVMFEVKPDGRKSKAFDVLRNGEAVMPAFTLYSSTADSSKKFKITVDDSGIIKTVNTSDSTEVQFATTSEIPTDDHINSLIDAKLEVIENGAY